MRALCTIHALTAGDRTRCVPELAEILLDCVRNGASVSFMAAITMEDAQRFWNGVFDSLTQQERIVLVAQTQDGKIAGTVQIVTGQPPNQPHRADISKLLVHSRFRRAGVGAALMHEAESYAARAGKSLLVLDTASGSGAERLYTRSGWTKTGEIPNYALLPDGRSAATSIFWKAI